MINETTPCVAEIAENCIGMRMRRLHRAITAIYDEEARQFGARSGQITMLVAIAMMGDARPKALARMLSMDKSTLSRDLKHLRDKGWIRSEPCDDGRAVKLLITPLGLDLVESATPAWRLAQSKAEALLSKGGVEALFNAAARL